MTTGISTRTLRMGTRRSALALAQSAGCAERLTLHTGVPVRTVGITTEGDTSTAAITSMGGTGVFVQAVRSALSAGRIDFAVHSYKDLPTAVPEGIVVAAVPAREDPRDALVTADGRRLDELPDGARVGTGSPRRAGQLLALRPGLEVVPLRGNVDTRLGRVHSGELDGVVLAAAGLARLGRLGEAAELLAPGRFVPAPAQGALAVECRADDPDLARLLGVLDDPATRTAVEAERAVLARLEAGCSAPVGAYARVVGAPPGAEIDLTAVLTSTDGRLRTLRTLRAAPPYEAPTVGHDLADALLKAHARIEGVAP
ncbi:hydroxymethylbilane synthase [Streptomyces sp. LX-29]|uniref:hydroxymethylbilane synthase n=1 Tax=Streptomyces sp. LX-29 TaxID=2900152 RepID=UPI00240D3157|nr:hydroxymethylbilane synthase [Streptomyces sp. LX-29]WFB10794.1 hydroxymethylbilane synthase [Streptomyces sp. LX-29]